MSADPPKGPRFSPWQITAGVASLVTAVGSLVGALAAAGVFGGGDPASAVQDAPTAPMTPATVTVDGTAAEERLARMIPPNVFRTCSADDAVVVPRAQARFSCRPRNALAVSYFLFDSISAVDTHMGSRLARGDSNKRCGTSATGASPYDLKDGKPVGEIVCYVNGTDAWIEWTNRDALVYAWATHSNGDWQQLFAFWESEAGPLPG